MAASPTATTTSRIRPNGWTAGYGLLHLAVARVTERDLHGEPGDGQVQQPVPEEAHPGERFEGTASGGAPRGAPGGVRNGHGPYFPITGIVLNLWSRVVVPSRG